MINLRKLNPEYQSEVNPEHRLSESFRSAMFDLQIPHTLLGNIGEPLQYGEDGSTSECENDEASSPPIMQDAQTSPRHTPCPPEEETDEVGWIRQQGLHS